MRVIQDTKAYYDDKSILMVKYYCDGEIDVDEYVGVYTGMVELGKGEINAAVARVPAGKEVIDIYHDVIEFDAIWMRDGLVHHERLPGSEWQRWFVERRPHEDKIL